MNEQFLDIGIEPEFAEALEKRGITEPTPIQRQTIPAALTGKHIIGQSATGTGKTFAYLLPVLQGIDASRQALQAVILAPTFELAMQIFHQAELLVEGSGKGIGCISLIGGANMARQVEKLKKKPQVAIGSAARIMELQKKGKLKLDQVKVLVLDEADKLLDDQNLGSVKEVRAALRKNCQYFLFSATISPKTLQRADFAADAHLVSLKEELSLRPVIENLYFVADFRDKIETLRKLAVALKVSKGLVFVNRSDNVMIVLEKLKFHGVKAAALNAAAGKVDRKKAIEDFKKGKVQLLIASDIAARGLDIDGIDFVFNLDLPENEKVYLHRAGRTGRAGKSGCAVSLADPKEIVRLGEFAKKIKVELKPKCLANGVVTDFLRRPQKSVRNKIDGNVKKKRPK